MTGSHDKQSCLTAALRDDGDAPVQVHASMSAEGAPENQDPHGKMWMGLQGGKANSPGRRGKVSHPLPLASCPLSVAGESRSCG